MFLVALKLPLVPDSTVPLERIRFGVAGCGFLNVNEDGISFHTWFRNWAGIKLVVNFRQQVITGALDVMLGVLGYLFGK